MHRRVRGLLRKKFFRSGPPHPFYFVAAPSCPPPSRAREGGGQILHRRARGLTIEKIIRREHNTKCRAPAARYKRRGSPPRRSAARTCIARIAGRARTSRDKRCRRGQTPR